MRLWPFGRRAGTRAHGGDRPEVADASCPPRTVEAVAPVPALDRRPMCWADLAKYMVEIDDPEKHPNWDQFPTSLQLAWVRARAHFNALTRELEAFGEWRRKETGA